jgi:hypothetical protein
LVGLTTKDSPIKITAASSQVVIILFIIVLFWVLPLLTLQYRKGYSL